MVRSGGAAVCFDHPGALHMLARRWHVSSVSCNVFYVAMRHPVLMMHSRIFVQTKMKRTFQKKFSRLLHFDRRHCISTDGIALRRTEINRTLSAVRPVPSTRPYKLFAFDSLITRMRTR